MLIYESKVGSHIENGIKSMKQMAIEHNNHIKTDFNDIEIIVNPDSDINKVIEAFHAEQNRLAKEYTNSPEGQARIKEREDEHMRQIIRVEELWDNQPDFSDLNSVITWLEELEKCSMMNLRKDRIVELFESKGYFACVNCGEDFKEDDKENWARWLIGQALECIQDVGAFHKIWRGMVER